MPHHYQITLLYAPPNQSTAEALETALRATAQSIHLPDAELHIAHNQDPPGGHAPIRHLVVFLADRQAPPDAALKTRIQTWLDSDEAVVPLLPEVAEFDTVVPSSLHAINALHWDMAAPPDAHVQIDLLRRLGMAEEERRVFLSYKRSDAEHIIEPLWAALEKRGFDVFLDQFNIDRGIDFQRTLRERLSDKAMVLLLESPGVSQSKWVKEEITLAMQQRMGLLALSWPEVVNDSKLQVARLPPDYRFPLVAGDFLSTTPARLSDATLARIVAEVEKVHTQAMVRRRRELLGSVIRELQLSGQVSYSWSSQWSLALHAMSPARQAHLAVTPRTADCRDLYRCDNHRASKRYDRGFLIHPSGTINQDHGKLLQWLTSTRKLDCLTEQDIHQVVTAMTALRLAP